MNDPGRQRRIAAGSLLVFALALVTLPARAGTSEDLAHATRVFERLKTVDASAVNRMQRQRRIEFWSHYYEALEQLGRMKVHQRMMTRHQAVRGEQFARALTDFRSAVETLTPMLPDLER